ncbi:hypothetical protein BKA80DRAFT_276953 [Phyllosticta citrichinensis]
MPSKPSPRPKPVAAPLTVSLYAAELAIMADGSPMPVALEMAELPPSMRPTPRPVAIFSKLMPDIMPPASEPATLSNLPTVPLARKLVVSERLKACRTVGMSDAP